MRALLFASFGLALSACGNMLPQSNKEPLAPWTSYAEAQAAFARVEPGKTTLPQLKALGFDPDHVPNVSILSYADLLRRLESMAAFEGRKLDPAIRRCVEARTRCFGYRIEQEKLERERVGNFFLDFLNFQRVTRVTGWSFDALVLVSNDLVVYKSWSGKPNISELEQERHPLGPLQGAGTSVR